MSGQHTSAPPPGTSAMTLEQALGEAQAAWQRNELAQVERLCRAILQAKPDAFDALHLMGMLAMRLGRMADAAGLFARAAAVNPASVEARYNLGLALQLTNIMRDLRTDAERGRIYLPQDEIRRFGYSEDELLHGRYAPAFVSLMRFQADRAHAYYRAARAARPPADRRRLIAADIMGGIYRALLREIEARQFRVFDGRIRVATSKKIALALAAYLRGQLAS